MFTVEFVLRVTPQQVNILEKRFEAARMVYNAILSEALKRYDMVVATTEYQQVRQVFLQAKADNPKGEHKKLLDVCYKVFWEQAKIYGLGKSYIFMDEAKYKVKGMASTFSGTWIHDHIDSRIFNTVNKRVMVAMARYTSKGNPKKYRPKFKQYGTMESVEGDNNKAPLRFLLADNHVIWRTKSGTLTIPAKVDFDNPTHVHALTSEIKQVRIVKRVIKGLDYYYTQLICDGQPLQRTPVGSGVVGLDIGPSTIAIVSEDKAKLTMFCSELDDISQKIAVLQRKLGRQRRANNPQNYQADGTIKKEQYKLIKSEGYKETHLKLTELSRKQAAYRKSLHGQLVNEIVAMGNVINIEKISYVAFQKMFGKSVGKRAPGMFVAKLRQRHEAGVIGLSEFSTRNTKLSQVCHGCGAVIKKSLSKRWHKCECGIVAQRDLYSAFLASCVQDGKLIETIAHERWSKVSNLLEAAISDLQGQDARFFIGSFGSKANGEKRLVLREDDLS